MDEKRFIVENLDRPIVLIGLMGAGKSKIGSVLAKALSLPFVDADDEIMKAAGHSISDIFELYGEQAFRDLESKVITRLLSEEVKVISLGGGAVMNADLAQEVWDKSLSVWLEADLEVMVERATRTARRPLLQDGDPAEILRKLQSERYPVYKKATLHVNSSEDPPRKTLDKVIAALYTYYDEQS